jgi:hypothetical protein
VKTSFGVLALLTMVGCSSLTPEGSAVRITSNPDVVKGCKFIGQVEGSDHMNGGLLGQGAAENNATVRLQNEAAAMGANTVFLSRSSTGFSGSSQLGEAYSCSSEPVSESCRWDVSVGEWKASEKQWCGSVTVEESSTKLTSDSIKGVLSITNRSKHEITMTFQITAMAGTEVVGKTAFKHDIGDSNTDHKHFAVDVENPKAVTAIVVTTTQR